MLMPGALPVPDTRLAALCTLTGHAQVHTAAQRCDLAGFFGRDAIQSWFAAGDQYSPADAFITFSSSVHADRTCGVAHRCASLLEHMALWKGCGYIMRHAYNLSL